MSPRISVITVCFNSAKTIEETLKSVIEQSYMDREHIIIDGGSTDGTLDILNRYKDHFSIVISEPDRGIYDAMNKGIELASGEILGFLNADDVFAHADVLKMIAQRFAAQNIDACYGDLIYGASENLNKVVRYWRPGDFQPGAFALGFMPPHPTFYAKRDAFSRWGRFDLSYPIANDVELMLRFMEKERCQTAYIPSVLVRMRLGGVSNRSLKNILRQNVEIIRAHRHMGLPISVGSYVMHKLIERIGQFIHKPEQAKTYA